MNSWLGPFSDWTLALLPRLFLYPGGLWMLLMLLPLCFLSGRSRSPTLLPTSDFRLPTAYSPQLAVGWVALALLPLPGAAPLPFPIDRLSLAGLLVTSLALGWHRGTALRSAQAAPALSANIAIIVAAVAPLAGGRALLQPAGGYGPADWLSFAAVVAGLIVLSGDCTRDPAAAVRWLGWFGLGAAPLWASQALPAAWPPWIWVGSAYLAAIVVLAGLGATAYIRERPWLPAVMCWGLAALSVLAALLR